MDISAKLCPFYVAKMLYEQTDEDHYLTIAQIEIAVVLKNNRKGQEACRLPDLFLL